MSSLCRQFRLIQLPEIKHVLLQGSPGNAFADSVEEAVHDVVVVYLQQDPAEHFLGHQQVLQVRAVVVRTCVAGAARAQWGEIDGVDCLPHVDPERLGRYAGKLHVVVPDREAEVEGNAGVCCGAYERDRHDIHAARDFVQEGVWVLGLGEAEPG